MKLKTVSIHSSEKISNERVNMKSCSLSKMAMVVKGDVLRFMRNIGGGGGHSLYVKDFNARLELRR